MIKIVIKIIFALIAIIFAFVFALKLMYLCGCFYSNNKFDFAVLWTAIAALGTIIFLGGVALWQNTKANMQAKAAYDLNQEMLKLDRKERNAKEIPSLNISNLTIEWESASGDKSAVEFDILGKKYFKSFKIGTLETFNICITLKNNSTANCIYSDEYCFEDEIPNETCGYEEEFTIKFPILVADLSFIKDIFKEEKLIKYKNIFGVQFTETIFLTYQKTGDLCNVILEIKEKSFEEIK